MGSAQFNAQQAKAAQVEAGVAEGGEAAAAPAEAPKEAKGPGRPDGPPPTQMQMAMGAGMGLAMPLWAISSFIVMLWTLLHVARLPNGGVGGFRTGSDLTQEEQRLEAYKTA